MIIAKNIFYRMLLMSALCLVMSACTADREADEPVRSDGPVHFSAMLSNAGADNGVEIGTRAVPGELQSEYLNLQFDDGDKIRIVNTTQDNLTPDFINGSYYEYRRGVQVAEDNGKYYVKYAFNPSTNSGIKWSQLKVNGNSYRLEAAFFPPGNGPSTGNDPLFFYKNGEWKVPIYQGTADLLKQSDLMLAHHLKHLSQYGNEIELKFRHVFSLIYVSLTVPAIDKNGSGFPSPTSDKDIPAGYLTNMRTKFTMDFHASVSSDGIILVRADDNADAVNEITMCPASDYSVDDNKNEITYNYLVTIPTQLIDYTGSKALFKFEMKKVDGTTENYVFIPRETPIMLSQGSVTQINLVLPRESKSPILVSASLLPWTQAYSDMILEEKTQK